MPKPTSRQTDRLTDRQAGRQRVRQTDRLTDRPPSRVDAVVELKVANMFVFYFNFLYVLSVQASQRSAETTTTKAD